MEWIHVDCSLEKGDLYKSNLCAIFCLFNIFHWSFSEALPPSSLPSWICLPPGKYGNLDSWLSDGAVSELWADKALLQEAKHMPVVILITGSHPPQPLTFSPATCHLVDAPPIQKCAGQRKMLNKMRGSDWGSSKWALLPSQNHTPLTVSVKRELGVATIKEERKVF